MTNAHRDLGAHAALAIGEAYSSSLRPIRLDEFRLRDLVFRHLHAHRHNHSIELSTHLEWARAAGLEAGHPLAAAVKFSADAAIAQLKADKARLKTSYAKMLFSMGWVAEADGEYHEALLLDECPAARVGRAAVIRHRMYQTSKGLLRRDLWHEAMELVEEALDLEESTPARELLEGLKGDERWL